MMDFRIFRLFEVFKVRTSDDYEPMPHGLFLTADDEQLMTDDDKQFTVYDS